MKKNKKIYLRLIGIIIFFIIIFNLDLKTVFIIIKKSNKILLLLTFFIFPVLIYFKSIRLKSLIYFFSEKNIPIIKLFKIYSESFFYGLLTPGKLGELSRVFFLERYMEKIEAFFIIIIDRVIDLLLLIFISFFSIVYILYYLKKINMDYYLFLDFIILISYVSVSLLFFNKTIIKYIKKLIRKIFKYFSKTIDSEKREKSKKIENKYILKWNLLILISWIIYFFDIYIIAESINLNIAFYQIIIIISISSIISLLPVSISGIGTRDITIIGIMQIFDKTPEKALALSLLILLIIYLNSILTYIGVLFFLGKEKNE